MENKKIFEEYSKLFLEKNSVINLISKNDEKYLYEKHIFDSLSIEKFFEKYNKGFKTLLDIGTGGGFPSLPIAIAYPEIEVVGIDSTKKKITAINDIAQKLQLKNFTGMSARVETLKDISFDIITSRAVARLKVICEYGLPLLNKNGYLVVYKSKLVQDELKEAMPTIKHFRAKFIELIEYKLPLEETFERNLVIIKR